MKVTISTLLFALLSSLVIAQETNIESLFKFDKRYSQCEREWVILPKSEKYNYSYGYIYLDGAAGFTFDLQGTFDIENGKIKKTSTELLKNGSFKMRLSSNTVDVSILPKECYRILNIQDPTGWIKAYYSYTDTVAHFVRWGYLYNDIGEYEIALSFLEGAYKISPHANELEFELSFSYNALSRYDEAILVLESAIKNDPKNIMFDRELGYSYLEKKDYNKAILVYQKGIDKCSNEQLETKSEMAINLATAYKESGNLELYKTWGVKAKEWAPKNSRIYKQITNLGF